MTPTMTPSKTPTPSYIYSTPYPSIFSATLSDPDEVSLINPVPNAYQSTAQSPNFITTPSFSTPAFLFSATGKQPNYGQPDTPAPLSSSNVNNTPAPFFDVTPEPGFYPNNNMLLPVDAQNNQPIQSYTPSNRQIAYTNVSGPTSSNLLASYSYAASPLIQSAQTAQYYANTPIDPGTLYGGIQSKNGFYQ
jgi:hypothetical protein